jgi:hypothetical protein
MISAVIFALSVGFGRELVFAASAFMLMLGLQLIFDDRDSIERTAIAVTITMFYILTVGPLL